MIFSSLPFLFFYLMAVLAVYKLSPLKLRNLILKSLPLQRLIFSNIRSSLKRQRLKLIRSMSPKKTYPRS